MPHFPGIGQNLDGGISDFRISGKSLIKEICHNSRTNSDIDMKLVPVTKLYKKNTASLKKIDDDVLSAYCDVILIFRFMANLEQSGSRILDTWSVKLTFPLIVTFYLIKTRNRTKKSLTQVSYY